VKDYSAFPSLRVEQAGENGDVFVVRLNRPERLNAIDPESHRELGRVWRELDRDQDCRAIVLTGSGRAFCAGIDHKRSDESASGYSGGPLAYRTLRGRPGASKLVDNVLEVEKPIITMINGPAIGLGLVLALLGDITVASDDAVMGDTHIDMGITPGDGGVLLLPLLVGMNRAKELLMTGDTITGREAAAMGLVNHAVPAPELNDKVLAIANRLASKAPYAMRTTKVSLNMILRRRALDILDLSHLYEQLTMRTGDHVEAVKARAEKRAPSFRGR
jgi:enoyl-CoA hydratase/carnithine racemase